jgi:hypothetical protein
MLNVYIVCGSDYRAVGPVCLRLPRALLCRCYSLLAPEALSV